MMATVNAPISKAPFHHFLLAGNSAQVPFMISMLLRNEEEIIVPERAHRYNGNAVAVKNLGTDSSDEWIRSLKFS